MAFAACLKGLLTSLDGPEVHGIKYSVRLTQRQLVLLALGVEEREARVTGATAEATLAGGVLIVAAGVMLVRFDRPGISRVADGRRARREQGRYGACHAACPACLRLVLRWPVASGSRRVHRIVAPVSTFRRRQES